MNGYSFIEGIYVYLLRNIICLKQRVLYKQIVLTEYVERQ